MNAAFVKLFGRAGTRTAADAPVVDVGRLSDEQLARLDWPVGATRPA